MCVNPNGRAKLPCEIFSVTFVMLFVAGELSYIYSIVVYGSVLLCTIFEVSAKFFLLCVGRISWHVVHFLRL